MFALPSQVVTGIRIQLSQAGELKTYVRLQRQEEKCKRKIQTQPYLTLASIPGPLYGHTIYSNM